MNLTSGDAAPGSVTTMSGVASTDSEREDSNTVPFPALWDGVMT